MINEDSEHQCPIHLRTKTPLTFSALLPQQR